MDQQEFTQLARKNPKGLLQLIEHGKMSQDQMVLAACVVGRVLRTREAQRVAMGVLLKVSTAEGFEDLILSLPFLDDPQVVKTVEFIRKTTTSDEIKKATTDFLETHTNWLEDPDSYEPPMDGRYLEPEY